MQFKSTYQKIKTPVGLAKTTSKIKSTTTKATTRVKSEIGKQVQHDVEANLHGTGATARVLTTHTLAHEKLQNRRRSYHVFQGTYGAGKGRTTVSYTHKNFNTPRATTHTASVNVRHVALGGAAAYGGYKAYQHRDEIREKAAQVHSGVHNAFHSVRSNLGAH